VTRLLITGADGFVGRWLVRAARTQGHDVIAAVVPGAAAPAEWTDAAADAAVTTVLADLRELEDLHRLADVRPDAVIHLAAIASGAEARKDPAAALAVNAEATALLVSLLANTGSPRFLFVSSGEVYGPGHSEPIDESAPRAPRSPYAVSKAAGEGAVLAQGKAGLPVLVARPFTHTGPGQATAYVLPALTARLIEAKRRGSSVVRTGNLQAVRDFLDVRDVVRAYLLLLDRGEPGMIYNVASGVGRTLSDCFAALAAIIGVDASATVDAALARPDDIPVLIGDASRLRCATGWAPEIPLDRTLQDLVNAQAD
jgi:GDP-4-dehydro-6-deoxy-D-mannose reductase